MSCLEASLTLRSSKRVRVVARTVGMSGYPPLSSVGNGSGPDGENESGVPTTAVFVPRKYTALL